MNGTKSNLILMATATLATLSGFSAIQAKADTASANSSDSATTKSAIAMSNTVAGAKQEVNDAQKTVTATQQAADTARTTAEASQELANNAQQQANLAQANLNQTTTAEKQAQQSANHATPTEIEHAQAAVTQQEKQNAMTSQQLSKDTEAVKAAQTNSATAQGQVNVANKNVETATQAVDQSQQQVDTAQQIVAGQGTAAAQADLERAKAEQAKAQATQDQAKNNLNTADQEVLNRQKQVDSTSLGADQANQAVTVATQTANQATQAVSQAQAKLDAALANFKGSDSNTIPLSQDYITDLTAFAGIIDANKPEYAELQKRLATEGEALFNQVKAYQPLATDQDVQLNSQADLTSEIRTELSLYAASLINQVRAAFGSEALEVSNGSVDYSEKIAEAYMADGWNWDTKSHDLAAINRVDQQMNLGPNAGGESISGGTFTDDPNNWKLTLADFKKMIYQGIVGMLFNDSGSNYEHTSMTVKPWLNTTSENVSPEQLGVSFVVDHDQYPDGTSLYNFSVHYNYINGFIAGGENPTQEEFDHTPIVSTQITANDVQTLRNDLATKQAAAQTTGPQLATAQNRAQAAAQSLKAAQLQLVTAKANQTAAQDSFNQAQSATRLATEKVTAAQANVDLLTAALPVKLQALATAKAHLASAQASLTSAQQALRQKESDLTQANLVLAAAQKQVAKDQSDLTVGQTTLAAKKLTLKTLQQAPATLAQAQAAVKQAQVAYDAAVAAATLAQNQATHDAATLAELQATANTAKETLSRAQANLAKLERQQSYNDALTSTAAKTPSTTPSATRTATPSATAETTKQADEPEALDNQENKASVKSVTTSKAQRHLANSQDKSAKLVLPQTNAVSNPMLSVWGLVLGALVGMFGLARRKQRD